MIFLSVVIGIYAFGFTIIQYTTSDPLLRFENWKISLSLHAVGGGITLVIGGFQFWPWFRCHYPFTHRNMGRVYLLGVLTAGVAGLILAPSSSGGLVAHFGFGLLAILWLVSGLQAYLSIRRGYLGAHKVWMMRNFSLTFSAVTLRLYHGLFSAIGVDAAEAFQIVAWLAWVPNLIVVEWYLNSKQKEQRFVGVES
jgi:uncharacterized membrane protein